MGMHFNDWNNKQTTPHAHEPPSTDIAIEVEAVDALTQLRGAGHDTGGVHWADDNASEVAEAPAHPWQPAAAGKKHREPVLNVQAAVQQMQTYLMDNSYIKVFKSDKHDDETVPSRLPCPHCRAIPYFSTSVLVCSSR